MAASSTPQVPLAPTGGVLAAEESPRPLGEAPGPSAGGGLQAGGAARNRKARGACAPERPNPGPFKPAHITFAAPVCARRTYTLERDGYICEEVTPDYSSSMQPVECAGCTPDASPCASPFQHPDFSDSNRETALAFSFVAWVRVSAFDPADNCAFECSVSGDSDFH